MFIRFDRMYERDTQTHTHTDTARRLRPRLHSLTRQNLSIYVTCEFVMSSRPTRTRSRLYGTHLQQNTTIIQTIHFVLHTPAPIPNPPLTTNCIYTFILQFFTWTLHV